MVEYCLIIIPITQISVCTLKYNPDTIKSNNIITIEHPNAISNKYSESSLPALNLIYNDTTNIHKPITNIAPDDIVQHNYSPINCILRQFKHVYFLFTLKYILSLQI